MHSIVFLDLLFCRDQYVSYKNLSIDDEKQLLIDIAAH